MKHKWLKLMIFSVMHQLLGKRLCPFVSLSIHPSTYHILIGNCTLVVLRYSVCVFGGMVWKGGVEGWNHRGCKTMPTYQHQYCDPNLLTHNFTKPSAVLKEFGPINELICT